jgi:Protein of unknown function (DUF2971)
VNLPTSLFKYEGCTLQALQNLKNQQIFFGSPLKFNDPYDCALSPSISSPSDEEVEKIRLHYLKRNTIPSKARQELETFDCQKLRLGFLRSARTVLEGITKEFLAGRGVSCFSEKNDNLLMWSHYGGHGSGFCLEFDTGAKLFEKARKVRYTTSMPEIDIVALICGDSSDQILDLYCTKGADWRYEEEWRCIHNVAGTAYGYPESALKAIYLGPEMPFTSFEIIALILQGQNAHTKLMQGSRSKENFSVVFEEVTYTPYLEAKKRGLLA